MLALITAKVWEGLGDKGLRVKDSTNGSVFLVNGNRIQGLTVRSSTKSKFLYLDNPYDFREKPSYVEAEETNAAIKADTDKTFQSMFISVTLYTDNDVTAATFTRNINCESIIFVEKDPAYPATKTFITYLEGSKKIRVRCAHSIKQVLSLSDDGNLTTS